MIKSLPCTKTVYKYQSHKLGFETLAWLIGLASKNLKE